MCYPTLQTSFLNTQKIAVPRLSPSLNTNYNNNNDDDDL